MLVYCDYWWPAGNLYQFIFLRFSLGSVLYSRKEIHGPKITEPGWKRYPAYCHTAGSDRISPWSRSTPITGSVLGQGQNQSRDQSLVKVKTNRDHRNNHLCYTNSVPVLILNYKQFTVKKIGVRKIRWCLYFHTPLLAEKCTTRVRYPHRVIFYHTPCM